MTVNVSCNVKQLTGIGEEWLVTLHGELLAKFWNGTMISDNDNQLKLSKPNEENTLSA